MRIESDGVGLHAEVDGPADGAAVVFLHGVSGSARTYEWLPAEVTAGRRIVRVDLRGHGRSDHAPGTYVIDRYGADVAAVLRAVAQRPAVIVGHSLGGVTAWWVAQRHPELVAAAFLEDPPLFMGEPEEHACNRAIPVFSVLRDNAARWQADGIAAAEVAGHLATAPFGPDPSLTQGDVMTQDGLATRAEALLCMDPGVLDAAVDGSTLAGTDTRSPVRVALRVLAADDAMGSAFPTRHAERMAQTHPAVEVVRVGGAGHGIHDEREHRADHVEQLTRFLAEHA